MSISSYCDELAIRWIFICSHFKRLVQWRHLVVQREPQDKKRAMAYFYQHHSLCPLDPSSTLAFGINQQQLCHQPLQVKFPKRTQWPLLSLRVQKPKGFLGKIIYNKCFISFPSVRFRENKREAECLSSTQRNVLRSKQTYGECLVASV